MSDPIINLPEPTAVLDYLRAARAELCRLTGEDYASVSIEQDGNGTKVTWTTYTDATRHIHAKTPHGAILAQAEEKRLRPRAFVRPITPIVSPR